MILINRACIVRAYVQFRGSEFHTRNARSRQLLEQRRAKAHSHQVKANSLRCSFPGSAWERFPRWLCHLRTEQAAEPPRTRSQAEPGNEQTNVGATLVFALRTTIVCEPMSEANVSSSFSNIGLILVFVRRANIRVAPTIYPKIYDRLLS